MKGHSSNDVFMIAAPELDGVTGLRLEALKHRDLPFQRPGPQPLGTWAMNELEVVRQEAGRQRLGEAETDQCHGRLFAKPEQKAGGRRRRRAGRSRILIDGNDDTAWNADRGVGPPQSAVRGRGAVREAAGTTRRDTVEGGRGG